LTFKLADEEYGVDILKVQEIRSWEPVTSIPNTPDFIVGVTNLRGIVVPIIDLRHHFSLDKVEYGTSTVVVIVKVDHEDNERTMGMVVDAVSEVYNISEEMMRETPELGGAISTEFIKGLVTIDEKMIILLDIDLMVSPEHLNIHEKIS
jgi:purine-binding chemotaxis protein CheW